jgi:hypothetical protein|tara:strand:- start:323 stop:484 length:162 start_codon:yes stop_codon:yes gene_type:complete
MVVWNTGSAAARFRLLVKNKKKNKAASSQAFKRVGPPNKESGAKPSSLTGPKQ